MIWHFEKPYRAPLDGLDGKRLHVDDYMRIRDMIFDHRGPVQDLPAMIRRELVRIHERKYPRPT